MTMKISVIHGKQCDMLSIFDVDIVHSIFILQDLNSKVDPKAIRPAEIYVTRRHWGTFNRHDFQNQVQQLYLLLIKVI